MPHRKRKRTRIVSSIPSRTRVEVSANRRSQEEMERIAAELMAHPGVHHVKTDVRTGSITLKHDHDVGHAVPRILHDLGVILGTVTDVHLPAGSGTEKSDASLSEAVADLNGRLGLSNGGFLDLRFLIPAGFGALAIFQLLRRGLQMETAPWYILAYAAFDSYVHLNKESAAQVCKP